MKSTGIVRRIDELGRVVIPIEMRNKFGIAVKDPVEMYVEGSNIVLRKYQQNCVFCGGTKNLIEFKNNLICEKCASKITETLNKSNLE